MLRNNKQTLKIFRNTEGLFLLQQNPVSLLHYGTLRNEAAPIHILQHHIVSLQTYHIALC